MTAKSFALPPHIPARAGVGFKLQHTADILADPARIGFVEIHAENFMGDGGPAHKMLAEVREQLPVSLHGVGLSIGADGPLDKAHLMRLKAVAERVNPGLVSEHLAWSSHGGEYFNDLLPLPYTERTLAQVSAHIDQVQQTLGRQMLLENPSNYLAFDETTMDEIEFIRRIVDNTGCGLILDVNNVHVSAVNLGTTAFEYIASFPLHAVGEVHLAGHAEDADDAGDTVLIDSHDRPVAPPVWTLYETVIAQAGRPIPTLIEWDNDVPEFAVLAAEAERADTVMAATLQADAA
ncbi:MAG: DUF692 domain-containing protein [Pseudomonadota bacterium]